MAVALVTRIVVGIIPSKKVLGRCKKCSRAMLAHRVTHLHAPKSGPTMLSPARIPSVMLLFLFAVLFGSFLVGISKCQDVMSGVWRLCGALRYRRNLGRADRCSQSLGF